jgi:uncharacterized membrane protein
MAFPLPALAFARMADVSPAGNLISDLNDAVFTSWSAATDYRGAALPAANVWGVTRKQPTTVTEAVVALPPAGTPMGLSPAIIAAGRIAKAGTMASPDASVASMLQVGINKNSGAYINWSAPLPMTSGQFFGYWLAGPTVMNAATTIVRSFISAESILCQIITSAAVQSWFYVGAIASPYNNDAVNNAESDNRLYGVVVSGGTSSINAGWLNGSAAAAFLNHSTVPGAHHCGVFQPGTGSLYPGGRRTLWGSATTITDLQDAGGWYEGDAVEIGRNTATNNNSGGRLGVIRGLYLAGTVQSGRYLRNGATDLFHYVSMNNGVAGAGMMLPAVP